MAFILPTFSFASASKSTVLHHSCASSISSYGVSAQDINFTSQSSSAPSKITYRVHASVEPNCLNAELQARSEEISRGRDVNIVVEVIVVVFL
jgi:hypothetical protein